MIIPAAVMTFFHLPRVWNRSEMYNCISCFTNINGLQ